MPQPDEAQGLSMRSVVSTGRKGALSHEAKRMGQQRWRQADAGPLAAPDAVWVQEQPQDLCSQRGRPVDHVGAPAAW